MARKALLAATALGFWALSGAAQASGDCGCHPRWKLFDKSRDCASRAMLAPANDTRVNLLYLLRDRAGLGTTGLTYPKPGWDDEGFGHAFLDWSLLNATLYPTADEREAKQPDYTGSRCASLASGGPAFLAALGASRGVPRAEHQKLATARGRLDKVCSIGVEAAVAANRRRYSSDAPEYTAPPLPDWPAGIASAPGKAFLAYLQASGAFYGERWDEARGGFAEQARSKEPWVAEASAYMLARVDLNAAIAGAFDEYGYFQGKDKLDHPAIARAGKALAAYLKAWPQGRFAASAQGLQRRVLWLAGDTAALASEYERLLGAVRGGEEAAAQLVEEIDTKLLFPHGDANEAALQGALLLATQDLLRMRDEGEGGAPALTVAALDAQRNSFAGQPELFSFLKASHAFHVAKDFKRVLQLIPDDARKPGYAPLAFSRQMLRGMALAQLGDRNEAGFWLELLNGATGLWQRPTIELALAMNYERHGRLAAVFAKGSPVTSSDIRIILLRNSAGPDILRAQAQDSSRPPVERNAALDVLLNRQLNHGDYAGFISSLRITAPPAVEDSAGEMRATGAMFKQGVWSDGYPCPALVETARNLARNPRNLQARLCLGDFWRLNTGGELGDYEAAPKQDELGGAAKGFAGPTLPRGAIYAAIIADPRAPANETAYALYRAINCYGPSGYNGCGGENVGQFQRRAWFQRLKRDYSNSQWARKQSIYW